MVEETALWLVRGLAIYATSGIIFGVYFIFRGVGLIDPAARDTSFGFKLVIWPGVAALWPILLFRLIKRQRNPPVECTAHRKITGEF